MGMTGHKQARHTRERACPNRTTKQLVIPDLIGDPVMRKQLPDPFLLDSRVRGNDEVLIFRHSHENGNLFIVLVGQDHSSRSYPFR